MSLLLRDVCKSFLQGKTRLSILQGVSAEVKTGEIVAVLGKSGSGKSTLLALLAGLDLPDSGSIVLNGQPVETLSPDDLTRWRGGNVGVVFQQYHLMPHLTAWENVVLPMEVRGDVDEGWARRLLCDLGLEHRFHHFPSELSGGECQRVAIARALVTKPALLLADEPSGSLDVATGEQVMAAFFQEVRKTGTTAILVTHSPELAARCDRRFSLEGGRLVPA